MWKSKPPAWEEATAPSITAERTRYFFIRGMDDAFTAADISLTYTLILARRGGHVALGEAERAYIARTTARDGYRRAIAACKHTKAWHADE